MSIVKNAVWYVETNKSRDIALPDIARSCGVTPFHLARVFRGQTGLSVMAYLRARRLSEAACELAQGDVGILTVALNAQYGSHEAFSRAFAEKFGITPKSIRENRDVSVLTLTEPIAMDTSLIVDLKPPRIEARSAFDVTGLSKQFTFETNNGIPALWQEFIARIDEVAGKTGDATYGVCFNGDSEGRFDYMAGIETKNCSNGAGDFQTVKIPAGKYAVFTHSGHISDFRKTMYTIWNKGLEGAGVQTRAAPDFELYDERFNGETGNGEVDIWIPIV